MAEDFVLSIAPGYQRGDDRDDAKCGSSGLGAHLSVTHVYGADWLYQNQIHESARL